MRTREYDVNDDDDEDDDQIDVSPGLDPRDS